MDISPELSSSIRTLQVNPVPYLVIFRSTSHLGGFRGCFYNSQPQESCRLCCLTSLAGRTRKARKVYQMKVLISGEPPLEYSISFESSSEEACFHGKLKNSRRYNSSKNKNIRDRVDSRVQLIGNLRVMSPC